MWGEMEYLSKNSHPNLIDICPEGPRAQQGPRGVPWLEEEVQISIYEACAVFYYTHPICLEWLWGLLRLMRHTASWYCHCGNPDSLAALSSRVGELFGKLGKGWLGRTEAPGDVVLVQILVLP